MASAQQQAPDSRPQAVAKARLDPSVIIAAALEVSATSGSIRLSAKALGAHLGVDPTAIYRHFRNKGELMEALLDELNLRSVRAVTAPPSEWQERLRQLSRTTLTEFCAHPAIAVEAMVLTTHGPGELAAIELMLSAFATAGLSPDDVVEHYALLSSHVLSNASGVARARAEQHSAHRDGEPDFSPWFDGSMYADPRKHPHIAELSAQLADLDDRAIFNLGVESVIRSAELIASANAAAEQ